MIHMPKRRTFLRTTGAAGVLGLIAGCTGSDGGDSGNGGTDGDGGGDGDEATETQTATQFNDGEIDFNVSPSVPQDSLEPQYSPIRDYLSEEFGLSAKMTVADNYSAVIQALGAGTSDIAETGPFAAALGVKSGNAEIIIQRYGYGSWTYKSIIAIRNDSNIKELTDLKGKKVAFSDRLSTSGALYPLYNLSKAGVDIGDLPEGSGSKAEIDPVFAGGHVSSFQQLKNEQVAAAGMGGFIRDTPAGPTPEEFQEVATTLDEQTGLPRAPIVVSPQLSEETKKNVQQAFVDAPKEIYLGADGKEDTDDDLWFSDVRKASVEKYQSVIDVANELNVGTDIFES